VWQIVRPLHPSVSADSLIFNKLLASDIPPTPTAAVNPKDKLSVKATTDVSARLNWAMAIPCSVLVA